MGVAYNPRTTTDGLISAIDFGNMKSFSANTFPNSLDIYDWYFTKRGNNTGNACTVARDLVTQKSPVGGIPLRMDVTGNDPHLGSYNTLTWNLSNVVNGQTWRVSVYAKASQTFNNCEIYIFGANSSGTALVDSAWLAIAAKTITITTEWQRFDHFITFNNVAITSIQMRLDGPNADGTGSSIWWDGLQVEPFALTPFNPRQNLNYSQVTNLISNQTTTVSNYPQYNGSGQLIFDGSDDFLLISDTSYPSAVSDPFSMEMVLNVPSAATWSDGTYSGSIFTRGTYLGSHGFIRTITNNTIGFWVRGDTGLGSATSTILRDTNYHCIGTWDGTVARLYINGVLQSSTTIALTGLFEPGVWWIGSIQAMSGANGNRFRGNIGVAKVYNKALTLDEVRQNFASIRGRYGI
jgi:hypothetical protein